MDVTYATDLADPDEEPPDFYDWAPPEEVVSDQPTRERLLDVVLQLREPAKVSEVADRATCGTETARDYLEWFASMGIARQVDDSPARYERNEEYLRWRRVEGIRATHTEPEIVDALASTVDAIESYRAEFGVESPEAASLRDGDRDVESASEAVSRWKTLERRADLLDAARRARARADSERSRDE